MCTTTKDNSCPKELSKLVKDWWKYITGKPLPYFKSIQLNLKTHLQNHLVPCICTDTTSLIELGENMHAQYTSVMLADRFALCCFSNSLRALRPIRNLYAIYFHFRLPQWPHNLFTDSTFERLYRSSCFYLQAIQELFGCQGDKHRSSL